MKFELNQKSIKPLILFGLIYLIAITIIIMLIWMPKDEKNYVLKYTKYTKTQVEERSSKLYYDQISSLLLTDNTEILYQLLDDEYIDQNKMYESDFIKYLNDNKYFANQIKYKGYSAYTNGDKVIYTIKMNINNEDKLVNVIEESPNNYSITFGDVTYEENTDVVYEASVYDIYFKIIREKKDKNVLKYQVEITNRSDKNVEIDFLDISKMILYSSTNNKYKIDTAVDNAYDNVLKKDAYVKKNMSFSVPASDQPNVNYLVFLDAKINGSVVNIEVPLK